MNTLVVLLQLLDIICQLLIWGLIGWAILSWLIAFNVINLHNRAVRSIADSLDRLFRPMLRPIRRIMPDMGGIDLSPMVLVLLIMLIQRGVPAVLADTGVLPGLVVG